jgi:hypothetical protein
VDDFGVKYVGKQHSQNLIDSLETYYTVSKDWNGGLYCGIILKWDYENKGPIHAWLYQGCPKQI